MIDKYVPYPEGIWRILWKLPIYLHQANLGWLLNLFPFVILTTKGRTSGLPRSVVLEYRRHGSQIYIISGWGKKAQWVKNIKADDTVTVQVAGKTYKAQAHIVDSAGESVRALYMFQRTSPIYDVMLEMMSSAEATDLRNLKSVADEFTIVRLDLSEEKPALPGVSVKYGWIAPLVISLAVVAVIAMVWTQLSDNKQSLEEHNG